jgi:hypothetical protein
VDECEPLVGGGDKDCWWAGGAEGEASPTAWRDSVGRCRLMDSKPVLKAPSVSALETIIRSNVFNRCFNCNLRRYNSLSDWGCAPDCYDTIDHDDGSEWFGLGQDGDGLSRTVSGADALAEEELQLANALATTHTREAGRVIVNKHSTNVGSSPPPPPSPPPPHVCWRG